MESVDELEEYSRILFLKQRSLHLLLISYGLRLLLRRAPRAKQCLRMLHNDVEPYVGLHLLDQMCELERTYAFDGRVVLGEGLEKRHYTFTYARLLPLLVDVDGRRVEEQDLGVGELLLLWLLLLGLQLRVNGEERAYL